MEREENATLRAKVEKLKAELAEERAFHGECPGGCGYWKEAAKMREAERDEVRAKVERLERVREATKNSRKFVRFVQSDAGLRAMSFLDAALAECEEVA